jgi:hypothetical protein
MTDDIKQLDTVAVCWRSPTGSTHLTRRLLQWSPARGRNGEGAGGGHAGVLSDLKSLSEVLGWLARSRRTAICCRVP